jgi:hypothetical protein
MAHIKKKYRFLLGKLEGKSPILKVSAEMGKKIKM